MFKKAKYAEAIDLYEQANEIYGQSLDLCCNLALVYQKMGECVFLCRIARVSSLMQPCLSSESAEAAATDALKIDPKSVKARYRRGIARTELGRWSSAITGEPESLLHVLYVR